MGGLTPRFSLVNELKGHEKKLLYPASVSAMLSVLYIIPVT